MNDEKKTKKQLIAELLELHRRNAELEKKHGLMDELLKQFKDTAQALIEAPTDSVIIIDEKGILYALNETAAKRFGKHADEMIGLCGYDLVSFDVVKHRKPIIDQVFRSGKPRRFEDERVGIWFDTVVYPISDGSSGKVTKVAVIARDITDRKKAEKELSESNKFSEALIDSMHDGFSVLDNHGVHINVNKALCKMTGFSREELIGVGPPHPYWPPEDYESIRKAFQKTLQGEFNNFELTFMRKNGERFPVIVSPSMINDKQGNVFSYFATVKDITERKQAEEALRKSEERYKLLINSSYNPITVYDSNGVLLLMNIEAAKQLGGIPNDFIGKSLGEIHPSIADMAMERISQVIKSGERREFETTMELPSGRRFFWSDFQPVRDASGKIFGVQIISYDFTERKMAEKALLTSEQEYQALFEESKDVVSITTPEGKIIDVNPAAVELFGYPSKEDFLKIDITHDLYANSSDRKKLQHILATKGVVNDYEVVFKKKDGQHVNLLVSSSAVKDEKGNITAYRAIMKDITERKRLEQQLLQAQKMESVGQLAGGIAHDFNNLLTAIIGYGHLLKTEVSHNDLLMAYVSQILNSAQKASNLTHNLLAFSRRQMINPKPENLNNIINSMKSFIQRIIGEDIEISIFTTDQNLTVMADKHLIEQVLMNLVTNARDAMPDGGILTIRTEYSELDNEFIKKYGYGIAGFYALISVEDTGQGMDEETRERLFDPFYTTKEVGKGTGLGLSMTYGI
ncbi:PAS domain S-box protein, partial [Candidatus Woesearchaeota archaeon]|nr:PAS domain S-box protein [Candidatus Woesearchaeota archaeon]